MKQKSYLLISIFCVMVLTGCETVKGVTSDVANTARNVKDIFVAGKTISDVVR